MDVPSTMTSARRPAPVEDYNNERQKGRKVMVEDFSALSMSMSMQTADPGFFGDFLRSCGGPSSSSSSYALERVGGSSATSSSASASASSSGCFGLSFGNDRRTSSLLVTPGDNSTNDNQDPTALIAKAMTNLSIQEREQAYEDLHGVSAAVHETPELIAQALQEMQVSLLKRHFKPESESASASASAYDMAMSIRPDYVQDPKLRLLFLRAERFDPALAAKRLCRFLKLKLKLFGPDKLCQWQIGLDDLDADGRFMVESGILQILPSRDSRGRAIFVIASNDHLRLHRNTKASLQMSFYMTMCVADDETNQRLGMVILSYNLGREELAVETEKRTSVWENTKLVLCMPIRMEAVHFCMASTGLNFTANVITKGAGLFYMARFRVHFGTHLECEYALLSFGVPSHLLPFTTDGELKTTNHKKWIQRRIVKEAELIRVGFFSGIDLPRRTDVLLGQGKPIQIHPGNKRLQELAEYYLMEYNQANPDGGKTNVARKIVKEILANGDARFLQKRDDTFTAATTTTTTMTSGWWEEVTDDDVLLAKASNAVRGIRKRDNMIAKRGF